MWIDKDKNLVIFALLQYRNHIVNILSVIVPSFLSVISSIGEGVVRSGMLYCLPSNEKSDNVIAVSLYTSKMLISML